MITSSYFRSRAQNPYLVDPSYRARSPNIPEADNVELRPPMATTTEAPPQQQSGINPASSAIEGLMNVTRLYQAQDSGGATPQKIDSLTIKPPPSTTETPSQPDTTAMINTRPRTVITPPSETSSIAVPATTETPAVTSTRPRIVDPINSARNDYLAKEEGKTGFWNKALLALKAGGLGALQGIGLNPNDPIAGGLGGFATGAAMGGLAPNAAKNYIFEQAHRPAIEQEITRKRAEEDRQRAIEKEETVNEGAKTDVAYRKGQLKALPGQLKREEESHQARLKQFDTEINNLKETRKLAKDKFAQDKIQQEIDNKYKERELKVKEHEVRKIQLTGGDENHLIKRAESYAYRAFPQEKLNAQYSEHYKNSFNSQITPEIRAKAAEYNPEALEAIKMAERIASQTAQNAIERESSFWNQLFVDELRRRALEGKAPPKSEAVDNWPAATKAIAIDRQISEQQADIFLRTFGYYPKEQNTQSKSTSQISSKPFKF